MAKKQIYTVATAHLDTIWSWDFETTVSKYIYNTLVDNFKLFEKYPTYKFSFEGSYRYELMKEYYPELFEKMKSYIDEGRWNVCGSAFENGDTNVPSPEALFRNILFGNSYFDENFNKRSVDIYLPDCFGFGWALPSIMKHSNLMGFTTQKLAWGSAYGTPFDIGKWTGVDGETVYASVNPHSYYFTLKKLRDWDFVTDKLKENEKYDLNKTYIFHGIGDRGGAPDEKSVAFVEEEIKKNKSSDIEVLASAADDIYFDLEKDLTKEQKDKLPVWTTELVMQNHGVGGYTSRAIGKRWNKKCEDLADMAERESVIASYYGTNDYNQKSLNTSWKRFIAHQFHDDLPGTSVQRAYRRSWNDYAMSMNQFQNEIESSSTSLTQFLKTDFATGTPIVVHNTLEFFRHDAVTFEIKNENKQFVRVFDDKGKEVKSQSKKEKDIIKVTFIADVDALGMRVYDARLSDTPCAVKSKVSISTENVMENEKYIVTLNRKGNITSIIDKSQDEREILSEPISLGLFKYNGSKPWPAWEMNFKEAMKDPDRIPNVVTITVEETGPARVSFLVEQKDKNSTFKNIIALSDGSEIVEVYSEIDWKNKRTMAKNKFAFKCSNEKATFDLGLGTIERENMNETLFEVPAQRFADITDKSEEWGVSVISECKQGWDKYNNNTLRMTVLHTPKRNYRIDSMQSMMELGLNRYSYAIFSHEGKLGAKTQIEARSFTTPLFVTTDVKHTGVMKASNSFCEVSTNDVIVRAIKKAEKTDEIVVRLNEGTKKGIDNYKLKLGDGILSAREVYASEEYKADAIVENGYLLTSFKPYEIKSFALILKPSAVTGNKTISTPANITFDKNIITKNGEITSDIDISLSREMTPKTVESNAVKFEISQDDNNALFCSNQKIKLSEDTEKLALLIASNEDKKAEFKLDDETVVKDVYSVSERFAAWDLFDLKETAYIKKAKLCLEVTHSHSNGKDNFAKGMYFYILTLDVKGKSVVTLPNDETIMVLSATELKNTFGSLSTKLYDEVEKRPFDYKESFIEKIRYILCKNVLMLGDKDNFIKDNNRGR